MDQPLSLQPSAQNRPLLQDSATSNITSLLSVRSYPLPESSIPQRSQSNEQLPISGDVFLDNCSSQNQTERTTLSKSTTQPPLKRQRREPKTAPSSTKKRGKPQEAVDSPPNKDPAERRRMQVRVAQRAYRSRQLATITGLNNRVSHLESILGNMNFAVLSFSEQLVQSGVLGSSPDLTARVHDLVKTFVSLASEASLDGETEVSDVLSQREDSSPASHLGPMTLPPSNISLPSPLDHSGSHKSTSDSSLHTLESPGNSVVELSEFIGRLHLACLYQGYLALCDRSIGLDRLQRPFGLLLSVMSRERLTSYFKAELHAQLSQRPLDEWDEIPFFSLGGAGTHYPRPSSQGQGAVHPFHRYQRWDTVKDPLSLLPPYIQEQLEGDWFDLQDLEGFLREKDVHLVLCSGEPCFGSPTQTIINIARLIPVLINRGVCLGRTPGFQRSDVDKALHYSRVP